MQIDENLLVSDTAKEDEAATNIQRMYKGHAARKRVKIRRKKKTTTTESKNDILPGLVNNADDNENKNDNVVNETIINVNDESKNIGQSRYSASQVSVSQGTSFPNYLDPERVNSTAATVVSLDKAIRFRHITCPHEKNVENGTYKEYNIYDFPISSFQKYGLGNFLYFKTLQRLGLLFAILSLLAAPAMRFATLSKSHEIDMNYGFENTFLGNFGSNTTQSIDNSIPKEDAGLVISILDLLSCVIMILFVWYLKNHMKHEEVTYRKKVLTIDSYTVAVHNLPKREFSRDNIADFFSRFGNVVDVAIAFNDWEIVEKYKKRGHLKLELNHLRRKKDKDAIATKRLAIERIDKQIQDAERNLDVQVLAAYVTFETQDGAARCINAFPFGSFWRFCMPKDLQYDGHKLFVERAPEPSNIVYSNLHYSKKERNRRRWITVGITALLISISMVVTFLSQLFRKNMDAKDTTSSCDPTIKYTKPDVINGAQPINCYCDSLGSSIYQERNFCSDYLQEYGTSRLLLAMAAITVVIINFSLQKLMKWVTKFERHHSLSHAHIATVMKLFISYFINTALLALLVNANMSGVLEWLNLGIVMNGEFDNFTVDWYNVVAVSMCITMLLNMWTSTMAPFLEIYYEKMKRAKINTNYSSYTTQNELNRAYGGTEFDLASRYAAMLNTMFVALFYSPGIPILLPIASATFAFQYWFDKAAFLRLYKSPPRYDASLESIFLTMMPYAVAMHSMMAIWFYTSPVMISYRLNNSIVVNYVRYTDNFDGIGLQTRILQWNAFPLFMFFILFIVYNILKSAIARTLCSSLYKCCRKTEAKRFTSITYWQAKQTAALESYHLCKQLEHQMAFVRTKSMRQLPQVSELLEPPPEFLSREATAPHNLFDNKLDTTIELVHNDQPLQRAHSQRPPAPIIDGENILAVQCVACENIFHVLDEGFSQQYQCPHCGGVSVV